MKRTLPLRKIALRWPAGKSAKGFAMVVTVTLMMLMSLIAIGILGLATVEVRSATSEESLAQREARANARLGLQMAIAKLQETVGVDQRVTAAGSLLGNQEHPHWVGAWRTHSDEANGTPVVAWDSRESYLLDERTRSLAPSDLFESWLVSGETSEDGNTSEDLVKLVSLGSVAQTADEVSVPLVSISEGEDRRGGYAFWCADQSLKASLSLPGLFAEGGVQEIAATTPPERFGIGELEGLNGYREMEEVDLARLVSHDTLEAAGLSDNQTRRELFHSLARQSSAVLADPMRGGLKRDLSIFLENGEVPARGDLLPALTDESPLLAGQYRSEQGPRYGALRKYADIAARSDESIAPRAAVNLTAGDKFRQLPRASQFQGDAIHPVMAQAEVYTRICYVRGYFTIHFYPRIVLWNPYNVELDAASYTVDFNHAVHDSFVIQQSPSGLGGLASCVFDTFSATDSENRMSFTLEATPFAPGEALVFSPKVESGLADKAQPLATRSGGENLLSAKSDPKSLSNFYLVLQTRNLKVPAEELNNPTFPLYANHNYNNPNNGAPEHIFSGVRYWIEMMDWWQANPDNGLKVSLHLGNASNYNARLRLPLLQLVDTDNWRREYQGRFNNGRWRVGGVEPIYDYEDTSDFEPWLRGCYGFRYKWWQEKNPSNTSGEAAQRFWQAAVLADYNLRSPFHHRSPFDLITDNGESHHWYQYGPYTCESLEALPWQSAERAAHLGSNGYRGNPFFGGAETAPEHVYPLYDLPRPGEKLTSLGRFQHAQLSPFLWHTSYPIGNSRVPANLTKRDATADRQRTMQRAWSDQVTQLPDWMKFGRRRDVVVYDLAYEANHELWDRYYLSGSTEEDRRRFLDDDNREPLPNRHLVRAGNGDEGEQRLGDFYQAASEVLSTGAFNVNCTDEASWAALLFSMNGRLGEGATFSRFGQPVGDEYNGEDPYGADLWAGFRSLDPQEVRNLARTIVQEVKLRGPFLSVSDFVNRRLVAERGDEYGLGLRGTLDRAIEEAGLNRSLTGEDLVISEVGYEDSDYEPGANVKDWPPFEHVEKSKVTGTPGFLQQGDILQVLGSQLVARGDTFLIRSYGEARSKDGQRILARAWCEAEVQRMPQYINSADAPEAPPFNEAGEANPALSEASQRFGRRIVLNSFRWLKPTEV